MSDDHVIQNCPVAGYAVHNVPTYDLVLMRLPFLAGPEDDPENPHPGRHYSLTRAQTLELAEALIKAVQSLERGEAMPEITH